jgi:DNA polymerase-1
MQQVPKRQGEAFKVMRSLYHAPEGMTWLCGDWSQFEFRIFAHYSEDNKLWQAYQDDPDIDYHQLVADMAGIDRRTAKTINLGLSFGMGENRLAKELGMDKEDAQELFKKYHEKFPKIKKFLNFASARGARRGYVKTLLGRRIRFPDKNKTYKAGALIFQGSAADVMKKKIIELNSNIDGLRLIVHDEFNFIVPSETGRETLKKLKEIMEHVPELNVPVRASVNSGKNWWEAS